MLSVHSNLKIDSKNKDEYHRCLESLGKLIKDRIASEQNGTELNIQDYKNKQFDSDLNSILQLDETFTFEEKLVLFLAISPYIKPGYFEEVMVEALPQGGEFIAFGGVKGQQHRGILPTGETALFLLAGSHISDRLNYQKMFNSDGQFAGQGILQVDDVPHGEPNMSGRLLPNPDWLEKTLFGKEASPVYSLEFPARRITTSMLWDDLVLHPQTVDQITDIQIWMAHHQKVLDDPVFGRRIKPGYRVLFHGKAGTGKTTTASLLGKKFDIPVYRIDLSQVVSKYIGETEKHIEMVFKRAERKNWILFFDEADALFGKRTNVQSSNDKFANQEVSYLLQRIEDFEGLLILASNFKNNIDDAFLRRFHNIIHFPIPGTNERYKLWTQSIPNSLKVHADINWKDIADKYPITGAEIVNVIYYASLKTHSRNDSTMRKEDVFDGIKKELKKQERAFN